jgi:hypothetical protein
MGPRIGEALVRLGYTVTTVDLAGAARAVEESSGQSFSRQRMREILTQPHVSDETLAKLAAAFGVTVDQLLHPETIDPE